MTDDNDVYTPAQFREHQDGYGVRDPDAFRHAGIVRDPLVSRFLSVVEAEYAPQDEAKQPAKMPGTVDGLEDVQQLRRMEGTETARTAFENGDMPSLKHLTGDQQQRADVSGMKAIDAMRAEVTGPAPMFYVWAEPGTGKTNFAFLIAQLWKQEHDGDALVASNVRTLMESDPWPPEEVVDRHDLDIAPESNDGWIPNFDTLQEWIEQDGDPMQYDQRSKLFIFDEASSSASGGGNSGWQTKAKMGPLAYKIRKYGGSLVVIGHDGKDVHPLIREMGVAIHKEGLKSATFYDDVTNRSGVGERFAVDGIPETDWRYDDKEPTTWSWSTGDEDGEDDEPSAEDMAIWTAIRCKEQGMTGGEVAEFLPYSRSWADTRYREYRDDDKHTEVLAKVEEVSG
jgi:hypothetical protein